MAEYVLLADAKRIFCEGCQFRYGCNPEGISVCPNHQRLNKAATDKVRPFLTAHYITNAMGDAYCSECGEPCLDMLQSFCTNCGANFLNKVERVEYDPARRRDPATEEAAVKFLTESGWMEKHDKEVWKKAEDYCASWDRAIRNRECQGMW